MWTNEIHEARYRADASRRNMSVHRMMFDEAEESRLRREEGEAWRQRTEERSIRELEIFEEILIILQMGDDRYRYEKTRARLAENKEND